MKQWRESTSTTEAHSTERNIFENAFLVFSRATKRHSHMVIYKGKISSSVTKAKKEHPLS